MESRSKVVSNYFSSKRGRQEVVKILDQLSLEDIGELCTEILKMPSKERQKEELMVYYYLI